MNKFQKAYCNITSALCDDCSENCSFSLCKRDLKALKELVNLATPKEVDVDFEYDGGYITYCPNCGVCLENKTNYCPDCGQCLDWEVAE